MALGALEAMRGEMVVGPIFAFQDVPKSLTFKHDEDTAVH